MAFNILSAKLTGKPDGSGWLQVYENVPIMGEKGTAEYLYLIFATSSTNEGLNSVLAGRQILSRIVEEYNRYSEKGIQDQLKRAIEDVISELSAWENVEITAVVVSQGIIDAVVGNGAAVLIFRNGRSALVTAPTKGVKSVSGTINHGDSFVLGTQEFFDKIKTIDIVGSLNLKTPQDSIEFLMKNNDTEALMGRSGALLISVQEEHHSPLESSKVVAMTEGKSASDTVSPQPGFLENIISKVKTKSVYLKSDLQQSRPNKKLSAVVGVILLLLLSLSIFFGVRKKTENDIRSSYIERLNIARHQVDEAEQVFSLDPERARDLMSQAREAVLSIEDENIEDPEIDTLSHRINENAKKILGEYRIEPQIFTDLALLSENFRGTALVLRENEMLIYDEANKKLVAVGVSTKRSETIAGPSKLDGVKSILSSGKEIYLLKEDGIYLLEGDRVIDDVWEGEVIATSYAGNIYVVDKVGSAIFRHSPTGSGFAKGTNWLAEGISLNLTSAHSVSIDGMIWVLTDAKVYKLSHGVPQNFNYSGIYPVMSGLKKLYTGDSSQNVYFLNTANSRVVVTDKEGEYKAQYIADMISRAEDIVVSETDKKIILLIGGKLYYIDIE